MTALRGKLVLVLLVGVTSAGAVADSTAFSFGAGEGEKKAGRPDAAARKAKVVRVPSSQDGILFAVGAEVKKGTPGSVVEVRFGKEVRVYRRLREGDKVQEGQMLAQLDDRMARATVAVQEARRAAAAAELNVATAMADEAQARLERLKHGQRPIIKGEDFDAAVLTRDKHREEAAAKRAEMKLVQLQLERAQILLDMHTIRSPVTGVIRRIFKNHGEGVRKLETLFEIEAADED